MANVLNKNILELAQIKKFISRYFINKCISRMKFTSYIRNMNTKDCFNSMRLISIEKEFREMKKYPNFYDSVIHIFAETGKESCLLQMCR